MIFKLVAYWVTIPKNRNNMKYLVLFIGLSLACKGYCQFPKLPQVNLDKRYNNRYLDSLIQLGTTHWRALSVLPSTQTRDTLKLETLSYIVSVFRYKTGNRDSLLYYIDLLTESARMLKQPAYEIKGLYAKVVYHQVNTPPKALHFCHQAITLIEKYPALRSESWQFNSALGEIFIAIEQYQKALGFLQAAKTELEKDDKKKTYKFQYANVLQQIGNTYKELGRFEESKKHLLEAVATIQSANKSSSLYYLYLDLGDLHRLNGRYEEALPFFLEADKESNRTKNRTQIITGWAWLSRIYCDLKNYDFAIEYGRKATQNLGSLMSQRIAYHSLYRAYLARQDWQNSLLQYEKHIAISDTLRNKRQIGESINIQNEFELNQLAIRSQQAQEIQVQKFVAVQKQAEIEKLKAKTVNDALVTKANETELKRKLETQALKTQAQRVQANQIKKIKGLEIKELSQKIALQQRTQNFLVFGFGLLILLTVGVFWAYYQLKNKNKQLAAKNQEISEALLKGQTTERKRVASELHDNLGGLLSALKMATNTLDIHDLHPQERGIYAQMVGMIEDANRQVRSLAHNLLPEELEKSGLLVSLEKLISKLNVSQKTQFELQAIGLTQRLDRKTEFNLYTIILELCNNIIKHANAKEASVELIRKDTHLQVLVSDDGEGIDAAANKEAGMGLKNLQERAEAIGAAVRVLSEKGEGTVVSLKLTMPSHSEVQTS